MFRKLTINFVCGISYRFLAYRKLILLILQIIDLYIGKSTLFYYIFTILLLLFFLSNFSNYPINIKGSSLAISLFIFPLDFFNHSTHCNIICARERFFDTLQKYIFTLLNHNQWLKELVFFNFSMP